MAAVDVRAQSVLDRFIDLASNANYVLDRFNDMAGEGDLSRGERLRVPSVGDLVVETDGAVRVDGASRQQATTSSLELVVDQEPWIPVQVPARDQVQSLRGRFMEGVADQAMLQLRNYMDGLVLDDYLATQVAFDNAGTFHSNPESDGLLPADMLLARGLLLRTRAIALSNLLWILDPLAASAVMGFTGWREMESNTTFGAETIGRIYGIPVVETQATRLDAQWTQAGNTLTAAAAAGGTITLTFSANTGIVPGNLLTATGLNAAHNFAAQAVQSVNAAGTQVTIATAAGDLADLLTGASAVVTENSAHNMLVDVSHIYRAYQRIPRIRFMPDPETTGDIMQVSTLFGFIARAGRVRTVHSPAAAI